MGVTKVIALLHGWHQSNKVIARDDQGDPSESLFAGMTKRMCCDGTENSAEFSRLMQRFAGLAH